MIKKGTWVEVEKIVLEPEDRSSAIPENTKKTPLKMWIRGNLQSNSNLNEVSEIKTLTGRIVEGVLVDVEPGYDHSFGKFVSEIAFIGPQAREILNN